MSPSNVSIEIAPESTPAEGNPPVKVPRGYLPGLDGVRGLAILVVLLVHVAEPLTAVPSLRPLLLILNDGWWGVDLFFVLSGYLITGILYDSKGSPHYFRNFYVRRSLRIFPLYYGTLALIFLIGPWFGLPLAREMGPYQGWYWLYGVNILAALLGHNFPLVHFWSLAVEEHFYLVWPLVVFRLGRRSLMSACVILVVAAAVARTWCAATGHPMSAYVLTPCRFDALAIGAFLALAVRGPGGSTAVLRPARFLALIGVAGLVILALVRGRLYYLDPVVQSVGFPLADLASAGLIAWAAMARPGDGFLGSFLAGGPIKSIGKYSYAMYVFHPFAMSFVAKVLGLRYGPTWVLSIPLGFLYGIGVVAATIGMAWLSWNLFEKYFLLLKRYFE